MKKLGIISLILNLILVCVLAFNMYNTKSLKDYTAKVIIKCHNETSKELEKLKESILKNDNDLYSSALISISNTIYPLSELNQSDKFHVIYDFQSLLPPTLEEINKDDEGHILDFISTYNTINKFINGSESFYSYDDLFKTNRELEVKYVHLKEFIDLIKK